MYIFIHKLIGNILSLNLIGSASSLSSPTHFNLENQLTAVRDHEREKASKKSGRKMKCKLLKLQSCLLCYNNNNKCIQMYINVYKWLELIHFMAGGWFHISFIQTFIHTYVWVRLYEIFLLLFLSLIWY